MPRRKEKPASGKLTDLRDRLFSTNDAAVKAKYAEDGGVGTAATMNNGHSWPRRTAALVLATAVQPHDPGVANAVLSLYPDSPPRVYNGWSKLC